MPKAEVIVNVRDMSWAQEIAEDNNRLRLLLQDIANELLKAEVHCPCGARPESPSTHPHVIGCHVGRALELWESASEVGL